jgi:outer membrane lipoprotein-sorting protein
MKSWVMLTAILFLALGLALAGCSKKEEAPVTEPAGEVQPEAAAEGGEQAAPTAGEDIKSYKYVLETDMLNQGKMRMEYLVAPGKMNMKISNQQGGQWKEMSHMIMNGNDMYMMTPMSKTALKMQASDEQMENTVPKDMVFVPDWNAYMKNHELEGFTKKGKETVNGIECTRYEGKVAAAMETIYVDNKGLIRRIQVPGENGQPARTMDIVEVQLNPSFSDADFLPPKGYAVQELPKMPGMPGAPVKPGGAGR